MWRAIEFRGVKKYNFIERRGWMTNALNHNGMEWPDSDTSGMETR